MNDQTSCEEAIAKINVRLDRLEKMLMPWITVEYNQSNSSASDESLVIAEQVSKGPTSVLPLQNSSGQDIVSESERHFADQIRGWPSGVALSEETEKQLRNNRDYFASLTQARKEYRYEGGGSLPSRNPVPMQADPVLRSLDERRQRVYYINPDFVLAMLNICQQPPAYIGLRETIGLPEGATVMNVRYCQERKLFALHVHHPSFPIWEDGDFPPVAMEQLTGKTINVKIARVVRDDPHIVEVRHDDIKAACQQEGIVRKDTALAQMTQQVKGHADNLLDEYLKKTGEELGKTVEVDPPKKEQRGYEFL